MQALVLNDDAEAQVKMSVALLKRGFQVVTAGQVDHAMAYADIGVIDLVLMSERAEGRLSHPVALAAELRNPEVTTMLLTPRVDGDVDELYDLLPSLYCLLGPKLDAELVATMAVAGVTGRMAQPERAPVLSEAESVAEARPAASDRRAADTARGTAEAAQMQGPPKPQAQDRAEATAILAGIMAKANDSLGATEAGKAETVAA